MLKPGKTILILLLAFAGCAVPPQPVRGPRALDTSTPPPAEPPPPVAWRPPAAYKPALTATNSTARTAPPKPPPAVTPLPRPAPAPAIEPWTSLARWTRDNGFGPLRQTGPLPAPTYSFTTTNGTFLLHPNSLLATRNGLEFHLAFEPQISNGLPYLHPLDLKKNLEPLARPFPAITKSNRVIVIDPGHGGSLPGALSVVDGTPEKQYTLDWALRLAPLLAANGWQVFLTRTNDVDLPLSNRVAFAEEHHADLFISLHFNSAAPNQDQAGIETYSLTPSGMPSTLTRGYDDDATLVFTNNAFDAENLQLAATLHQALLPVAGIDRGLRHARFLGVLRGQNRPAVLIEGGYLSNPEEAERIADPAYRQELAEAVAQALNSGREKPAPIADTRPAPPEKRPEAAAHNTNSPSDPSLH
ncbi:MAG: N-acetylmuramoyl-L-alanine amidase [Verrucomicrobiota bacterium]